MCEVFQQTGRLPTMNVMCEVQIVQLAVKRGVSEELARAL